MKRMEQAGPAWKKQNQAATIEKEIENNAWNEMKKLKIETGLEESGTKWNTLKQVGTVWKKLEEARTKWNILEQVGEKRKRKMLGRSCNKLEQSETAWNKMQQTETSWNFSGRSSREKKWSASDSMDSDFHRPRSRYRRGVTATTQLHCNDFFHLYRFILVEVWPGLYARYTRSSEVFRLLIQYLTVRAAMLSIIGGGHLSSSACPHHQITVSYLGNTL